jgi:hypothetical protein
MVSATNSPESKKKLAHRRYNTSNDCGVPARKARVGEDGRRAQIEHAHARSRREEGSAY